MTIIETNHELFKHTFFGDDVCSFAGLAQTMTVGIDANNDSIVGMISGVLLVMFHDSCTEKLASIFAALNASRHERIEELWVQS